MSTKVNKVENDAGLDREISGISSSTTESKFLKNFRFLSISEHSYVGLQTFSRRDSFENSTKSDNPENCGDDIEMISLHSFDSIASAQREQVIFLFLFKRILRRVSSINNLFRENAIYIFIFQQACGVHMLCTYVVSRARRSRTAATGVAKYYRHVQTGL